MKQIAVLISDSLRPDQMDPDSILAIESSKQLQQLTAAFAQHGLEITCVPWRQIGQRAEGYDAVLPLLAWDYFEGNEVAFLDACLKCKNATNFFNAPEIVRWNSNKRYLDDLQKLGAPVIPTTIVNHVTPEDCERCFQQFDVDKLVIKPLVGGGSWRQVLLSQNDPFPSSDRLPPAEAMIQPFEAQVIEDGEYSFLYFGGVFSHALIKRAASGDYRVQAAYGGTENTYHPTAEEKANADAILANLSRVFPNLPPEQQTPLYARVDLIRGHDGQMKLIELELIEPFLYLSYAEVIGELNQGALLLATMLDSRLLDKHSNEV